MEMRWEANDEMKLRDNQTLKRDNKEVVSKDDVRASIKARLILMK